MKSVMISHPSFTGFSPKAVAFLRAVHKNNNREWFQEHKPEYIEFLYEPFKALAAELTPTMEGIDPAFVTEPHRVVSRIYRDIRFSRNKLPYRSAMWFSFHRRMDDWKDSPVFFMELSREGYQYGLGFYQAVPATMQRFRAYVDRCPDDFLAAISFFSKRLFRVDGDYYKRPIDNPHPAAFQPYYQAKSFYVTHEAEPDSTLYSRKILHDMKRHFERMKPLYDFIWRAKQS